MDDITTRSRADRLTPAILLAAYVALFTWGAIGPYDRATWWAENIPIVLLVGALVVMWARGVRFSPLAYVLMAVLPYWHTVGGHYTFERVPFDWFSRAFGFERNMYDRIGHFSVGFYAFGILEYLLGRRAMSPRLATMFAIFTIAFVAMTYELIEWGYAAYGGNAEAGANFLGSQGDIWDAQKDMLMDTLGAIAAACLFFVLGRGRDRAALPRHAARAAAIMLVAVLASDCRSDEATGTASGLRFRLADVDAAPLPVLLSSVSTIEGLENTYVVAANATLAEDSVYLLTADLRTTGGAQGTRNYTVRDTAKYSVEDGMLTVCYGCGPGEGSSVSYEVPFDSATFTLPLLFETGQFRAYRFVRR